ncbi:unnamed protein product [Meloidogyne enterolobii]|uniref:Uncharacterized protein n=2 Tax=Meloidogyne enterolobii TaxID=390850 RepID=A0A6V7XMF9_MELEN|nr:unnamed protein product [Meloidogyne enterolobii]
MVNVNASKLLFATASIDADEAEKQRRLFILGLMILFGWMLVIVFCVYPQLFSDLFTRYLCCCFTRLSGKKQQGLEELAALKREQERVRTSNRTFIGLSLATTSPSNILLKQVGFDGNMVEYDTQRKQFVSASIAIPESILEIEDIDYKESEEEEEDKIERSKRESQKSKKSNKKLHLKDAQ